MANEILVKSGTAIVVKAAGGDYAMTMTGILDTEARESAKIDLGATRAVRYSCLVEINMDAAPDAGKVIEFWWSSSPSAVAGTQNTGGASGTDADYKNGEENEWKLQLQRIGVLVLTNDADGVVQTQEFLFFPLQRYGSVILVNMSAQTLEGDDDSHRITLTPLIDEIQ